MPVAPDERREGTLRRLEDQALLLNRLQLELANFIHDMQQPVDDFRHFVMDPEGGLVARVRHVEVSLGGLEGSVGGLVGLSGGVREVGERVSRLEAVNRDRLENKRWVTRDVAVAGILAIVTAVVTNLVVWRLTHP